MILPQNPGQLVRETPRVEVAAALTELVVDEVCADPPAGGRSTISVSRSISGGGEVGALGTDPKGRLGVRQL